LNEELWERIAGMSNPLRQQMIQFAKKCETNKNMDAVISIAKIFMKKSFNDFNTEDYLFSCVNGLLDLKTGKLLDHDSKYLLTQTSSVEFNPEGTCNNFLSFLDDITNSDEKLKDYLQKLVGYCLTASISERAVFIFYGHGRNGKSTFLRILHELLGDYTKAVSTQTFTDKRSDSVRNDLASLHDARLVATSELGRNGVLDATLIKELTGGDPITCRFLYRENFSFIPKFKLIMAVNQRPYPSVRDQAIWDRIHEVPFKVRISDDKLVAQEQLLALFHLEMSGILNWALEGCLKWQKEGLGMPESVVEATQDYKTAVDPTSLWVETRYTGKEDDTVPTGLLFDDYMKFARENEINLSDNFDSLRFGRTIMKKFKSRARRIDGSIAKHYFGFKLPN
jgi:putative DNA primase/helicase